METNLPQPERDSGRLSVIRIALSGVCFLGGAFLALLAYRSISILASGGLHSVPPSRVQESMIAFAPWACVNIISMVLAGIGLLCRRPALTAIGGCILVLSTFILFMLQT
jgi:hypothetical protein